MLGIYIHLPFCESKCNYCAFNSFVASEEEKEKYLSVLREDISFFARSNERVVDTVYFGGGTPSLLSTEQFKKLIEAIKTNYKLHKNCEITLEANPNSLTEEKLLCYKENGVNRLSIGVQSLNDESLKFIERRHDSSQAIEKIKLAKKYFNNISCDLLIGLPTISSDEYIKTLSKLIELGVKHISSYMLQIEENTPLKQMVDKNPDLLPGDDECAKFYEEIVEFLEKNKFYRYEVSNFAKKGFESRHNIKYWTNKPYIGFGLSAHSYIDGKRWACGEKLSDFYNHKHIMEEYLGDEEKIEEHIMLGLRCFKGIDISYLKKLNYDIEKNQYYNQYIKENVLIKKSANRVILNPKYYEVNNLIITNLMP